MSKVLFYLFLLLNVAHAAEPLRVAVIDTGLDLHDPRFASVLCPTGHADLTGEGIEDLNGHGTHVVGLIMQHAKDSNYCIVILKFFPKNAKLGSHGAEAVERAMKLKVNVINYSAGGANSDEKERYYIKYHPEVMFVAAAGNENEDLGEHPYYPASYSYQNVISVGCLTKGRIKCSFSNYGNPVTAWEVGDHLLSFAPGSGTRYLSGTSMSAAVYTGKLVYNATH